jgi:hypothetical protein
MKFQCHFDLQISFKIPIFLNRYQLDCTMTMITLIEQGIAPGQSFLPSMKELMSTKSLDSNCIYQRGSNSSWLMCFVNTPGYSVVNLECFQNAKSISNWNQVQSPKAAVHMAFLVNTRQSSKKSSNAWKRLASYLDVVPVNGSQERLSSPKRLDEFAGSQISTN